MTDNTSLMAGRTVLITGGTGGIGRATAEGLARLGAHVAITGRDLTGAEAAAAQIAAASGNPAIDAYAADLSSQAEVRGLARAVLAAYPRARRVVTVSTGGQAMALPAVAGGVGADAFGRTVVIEWLPPGGR